GGKGGEGDHPGLLGPGSQEAAGDREAGPRALHARVAPRRAGRGPRGGVGAVGEDAPAGSRPGPRPRRDAGRGRRRGEGSSRRGRRPAPAWRTGARPESLASDRREVTPESIQEAFDGFGFVCSFEAAVSLFLAESLGKPLLLEGPPGVGKTEIGKLWA